MPSMRSPSFRVVVALLAAWLFAASAWADDYPSRPIHLVVPAPAGGGSDIYGRVLAQHLSPLLGQPVVVENKPGAAGRIAYEYVARSKPDGYTIIIATSAILLQKLMYQSLPYDPVRDFAPIARVARNQQILVIPASVPATDLRSFIALVKIMARPDVQKTFLDSGIEPGSSSVEEFSRNIDSLLEVFRRNMTLARIQPQP
jgi:tripartite-type tricarboxylate transporter receptor subunit TctC